MSNTALLPDIKDLIDNFSILDNWEDRYQYVIDLGDRLAPMDDAQKNRDSKVEGCVSQVWLVSRCVRDGPGPPRLHFQGDSDARIVRGLIAILFALYDGRTADTILDQNARDLFQQLGLSEHLTPQRSNGFYAMTARIQADAENAMAAEPARRGVS